MRKDKILTIICMIVLVVACLTFGVFALNSMSFSTTGTIKFNAYDLDILVHGEIMGSVDKGTPIADYKNATKNIHGVFGYSTYGNGTLPKWEMGGLWFDGTNANNLIIIKFTITNYSKYPIEATATVANQDVVNNSVTIEIIPMHYCYDATYDDFGNLIYTNSGELILKLSPVTYLESFASNLSITIDITPSSKTPTTTGFTTSVSGDEVTITKYSGSDTKVIIPRTIDGKTVTMLSKAFSGCSNLSSITIPDSVTSIVSWAFFNCTSLSSITIPNSVTSIGSFAFNGCIKLSSITIPDSVKSIGSYAFDYCTSLTSITIPNSVTSIGRSAFSGCSSLSSITIPSSVTSIEDNAFYRCTQLKGQSIGSETNVKYLGYTDGGNFVPTVVYDVTTPSALSGEYTIPNTCKIIYDNAFRDCTSLSAIIIPNSITNIGGSAFSGCSSLSSITIPNSVTSIGDHAFYNCSNLSSVIIDNAPVKISSWVFAGCSNLVSITIPESVIYIGLSAFYGCKNLTGQCIGSETNVKYLGYISENGNFVPTVLYKVTDKSLLVDYSIVNTCKDIYSHVFENCTNLSSITIPSSVTRIEWSAFSGCSALNSVYIDSATIAKSLISKTACEYIINYLQSSTGKLYIKSDIPEESIGSYVTNANNFTKEANTVTANGVTYNVYTKK